MQKAGGRARQGTGGERQEAGDNGGGRVKTKYIVKMKRYLQCSNNSRCVC